MVRSLMVEHRFLTLSMRTFLAAWFLALLLPLPAHGGRRLWVETGGTLSQIAERYGVSTSQLMQLNASDADLIQTAHSCRLPATRRGSASVWTRHLRVF